MSDDETPEIDIDHLAAVGDEAIVVDVRQFDEYAEGHVPGAMLIPMAQLAARMHELDDSRPVYVVCASGNRSKAMTDVLRDAGFEARSVAGGTNAWIKSGRPIERATR